MIQLTARIFQDGNLIGYQATDGVQTQNLTKQEAWAYAKQKQVLNVVASGTLENPSLSGTNGFQLKGLPELTNEILKQTEGKNDTNIALGKSLLVMNTLYDGMKGIGPFGITVIGYKVKNIGSQDINYTRIKATEDHAMSSAVLSIGDEVYINRAELAYLCEMKDVGMKLANGKVVASSKIREREQFERLSTFYFAFDKEIHEPVVNKTLVQQYIAKLPNDDDIKLDIRTVLNREIVDNYFCPPIITEGNKASHQTETIKNVSTSPINLFKRFSKR